MANYTPNLNLEKPLQTENYDVDVFNDNFDKIDNFAGQTPARALTADKLTVGAKINNVLFNGTTDIDIPTGANTSLDNVTNTSGFRKLVEAKISGTDGYKVFREYDATTGNYVGLWCEEWGETNGTSGERNIGFTNTFKDTNYNASFCWGLQTTFNTNNIAIQNFSLVNANARGFSIRTGVTTTPIRWKVEGYLAEGEE